MAVQVARRPARPARPSRVVRVRVPPTETDSSISRLIPLFQMLAVEHEASPTKSSHHVASAWSHASPAPKMRRASHSHSPPRARDVTNHQRRNSFTSPHSQLSSNSGRRMKQQYTLVRQLQCGKRGGMNEGLALYRGSKEKQLYVSKAFRTKDITSGHALREIRNLQACASHPNINHIAACFFSSDKTRGNVMLDYCELGDLSSIIERHSKRERRIHEGFIWWAMLQIAQGLMWCHYGISSPSEHKPKDWDVIYHRDLKSENIFLTWSHSSHSPFPRLVLGDFGCSAAESDIKGGAVHPAKASGYTPGWQPPEHPHYNKRSDIWQTGGIAQCLSRLSVSPSSDREVSKHHSDRLNDVVYECMRSHSSERLRADQLVTVAYANLRRMELVPLPSWSLPHTIIR